MSFPIDSNDTLLTVKTSKKNHTADHLRTSILNLLSENYQNGLSFKSILQQLPARFANRNSVKKELGILLSERLINRKGKGYRINSKNKSDNRSDTSNHLKGLVQKHKSGVLIVGVEDQVIKVYPENSRGAIAGDKVSIQVTQQRANGALIGRITKILERGNLKILFKKHRGQITPRMALPLPLKLCSDSVRAPILEDVWYLGQVTETIHPNFIEIKIVQKASDELDFDAQDLLAHFNIPTDFSRQVIACIESNPDELCPRLDITDQICFTIDGETAKDFDDAISISKQGDDFKLGVHIADVSHFVRPDSAVDLSARSRGTSLYFPKLVIPMLPAELSDDLCSLVPEQDRHAMTCEMLFSAKGNLKKAWFYPSKIRSKQRFTYEQVQAIYEGQQSHVYNQQIQECYALYDALWKQRIQRGTIDFDLPEPQIALDENYEVESIAPLERLDAHKVIEEFMIAANVCVARFCAQMCIPIPFRHHGTPRRESLEELRTVLALAGINLSNLDLNSPASFQQILERCDSNLKPFLQPLILRSMQQAIYCVEKSDHFGLALEYYCHFTSPIRRYPDLIVHRQMRQLIIDNQLKLPFPIHPFNIGYRKKLQQPVLAQASKISQQSSQLERRAVDLEREYQQRKKVAYMSKFLNMEFEAQVSGVIKSGVFATIPKLGVEGFLAVADLPGYWEFFEQKYEFVQKSRSKNRLRPGDFVGIRVVRADKDDLRIDFELSEEQSNKFEEKRQFSTLRKMRI